MSTETLESKHARALEILRSLERVAVAFSAGADSTFVLKLALDALGPENVVAVTGRSASLAVHELEQAVEIARRLGARHVILDTDEMADPRYAANPVNRCFYCKSELYNRLAAFIAEHGLRAVVNGNNVDDLDDHRPGHAAAEGLPVRSPCIEAGLTKQDIRELSRRLGLPTSDKPASPCLASRIPYGEPVTPEKLRQIEAAESALHDMGFQVCRVRHHGTLARIELPADEIRRAAEPETRAHIDAVLRACGFAYVALDLRGFRSGSLNEVVQISLSRRPA